MSRNAWVAEVWGTRDTIGEAGTGSQRLWKEDLGKEVILVQNRKIKKPEVLSDVMEKACFFLKQEGEVHGDSRKNKTAQEKHGPNLKPTGTRHRSLLGLGAGRFPFQQNTHCLRTVFLEGGPGGTGLGRSLLFFL